MRERLMEFLCCPRCRTELGLTADEAAHGEIVSGRLSCERCGASWPVRGGVPDFVGAGGPAVEQTTSGFARNWRSFNDIIRAHESLNDDLLRDWVAPVELGHFDDRVVMDAGCGMGRWASVASRYRPRALIAFDYSDIAYTAHANLRMLPHVHVLRADIFNLPIKPLVDVAYSIGVLHHTPDPGGGFDALTRTLAPDGVLVTWTYGAENNEWITRYVDPLRHNVTTRMPHLALLGASKLIARGLHLAARVYERLPEDTPLFYASYIRHLRRYPLPYMEHIVYDHLVPQLAEYIPRGEVESWARRNGMAFRTQARNGNSWRMIASRTEAAIERVVDPTVR